jgi:hypothetical protein
MISGKKEFEEWRKTDDYKRKALAMELVAGKTLTGLVKLNTKPDRKTSEISMLFISNNVIYTLMLSDNPERIKDILTPNSTITVKVHVPSFAKGGEFIELRAASIEYEGKEIYRMKQSIPPPFLSEVNKVRFADGKVNKVTRTGRDSKELEILANGYVFLLQVNSSQVPLAELDEVKAGDDLRFRFVHEVKTNAKAYLIKDWVCISKDIKSYGIKNRQMFNRFYEPIVSSNKSSSKIISGLGSYRQDFGDKIEFTAKDSIVVSEDKSVYILYGAPTLTFNDYLIKADQITFYPKTLTGVAKLATLVHSSPLSTIGKSDSLQFDFRSKKFNHFGIK